MNPAGIDLSVQWHNYEYQYFGEIWGSQGGGYKGDCFGLLRRVGR
jgi:hypothetical protein